MSETGPSNYDVTEHVISEIANCTDERVRQVVTSLVRHLHAFARDVRLTEEEWIAGIRFLTETGHMCNDKRQEFILLSDVLGLTMLLVGLGKHEGGTASSVLGPFYVPGSEAVEPQRSIERAGGGKPCIVAGRVLSVGGTPIAGASLDIWQVAANGLYAMQDPGQPEMNLRGKITTDAEGRYELRTIKPVSYSIPTDGPVGMLLRALGRHPNRPAHIHFIVSAPGYASVTTQIFVEGDPYIDSDAVFGVNPSLVVPFQRHDSAEEAERYGVSTPFYTVSYDFVLQPAR